MKYRLIGLENNIRLELEEMPNSMKVIMNNIITNQTTVHKPIITLEKFIDTFKVKTRQRRPRKKLENFLLKESDEPSEELKRKRIKKKGKLKIKQSNHLQHYTKEIDTRN